MRMCVRVDAREHALDKFIFLTKLLTEKLKCLSSLAAHKLCGNCHLLMLLELFSNRRLRMVSEKSFSCVHPAKSCSLTAAL